MRMCWFWLFAGKRGHPCGLRLSSRSLLRGPGKEKKWWKTFIQGLNWEEHNNWFKGPYCPPEASVQQTPTVLHVSVYPWKWDRLHHQARHINSLLFASLNKFLCELSDREINSKWFKPWHCASWCHKVLFFLLCPVNWNQLQLDFALWNINNHSWINTSRNIETVYNRWRHSVK